MSRQLMSSEWPAGRIVHLGGGFRAVNHQGPEVDLQPTALNGQCVRIKLGSYAEIYANLETLGLLIVGVDFYSHVLEFEGQVPPNWRPYHKSPTGVWPCDDIGMKWAHIGHAAHKRKNGRLWDLASRIAHQMRVCGWRMRQVSEAYQDQLFTRVREGELREG